MHGFVFAQLGLTIANELLFSVNIFFNCFYVEDWYGKEDVIHFSISLGVLTFILSQWVFVYQYLKVAILMPFILDTDSNEEIAEQQEHQSRFKLTFSNIAFISFAAVCVAANEFFRFV